MEREIRLTADGRVLAGSMAVPESARGIIVFAHGSGSGRHSPRNRYVATVLQRAGLATLLLDLLTEEEEAAERFTRHLRFDIGLLSGRLVAAVRWASTEASTRGLAAGCFGASTGAAAALIAAAREPDRVLAVVSRGGRPDLADTALVMVRAPTLLIVGGADTEVIALNRGALRQLPGEKRLEIVPGATHLFEEPGALEQVAALARDWFVEHLAAPVQEAAPWP